MSDSGREVEIKLRAATADEARERLERAGFRASGPRAFESNEVFDTAEGSLRARRELLRLRDYAGQSIVTYKGPPEPGPHKARREVETPVGDGAQFRLLIEALGYRVTFRYEKYRTPYAGPGGKGVAVLDETPIGVFIELEGEPAWIDKSAQELGFSAEEYIVESFGSLYLAWCNSQGVEPSHMVFGEKEF